MFDSLFGLDDRADGRRKAPRDRRSQPHPAQQQSTAKKPKGMGTGQQVERAASREVAADHQPLPAPVVPRTDSQRPPPIKKLTKEQW